VKLSVPDCYLDPAVDRVEKILTWSLLSAALASVPATYWHSSKGSMHELGVAVELFVTVTSGPARPSRGA